jgi:thermitase
MAEKKPNASVYLLAGVIGLLGLIAGFCISYWMSASKASDQTLTGSSTTGQTSSPDERVSGLEKRSSAAEDSDPHQLASKSDAQMETLRARLKRPGVVPGEAVLSFGSKDAMNRFLQQATGLGLTVLGSIPELNSVRLQYGTLDQLRGALGSVGIDASAVEGNPWLKVPQRPPPPQPDPNNQLGTTPFGESTMAAIGAGGDRSGWGDTVIVAVLDTGVLDHPTFGQNQVTHWDLVNDGQPFNSHGTSVASLIGGQNPQAPGVAPGAQIFDIRVANAEGTSIGSRLAEGIVLAADSGANEINISLAGSDGSDLLVQAILYAKQRNIVIIAAAGNDGYNQLAFPAAYQGVISVGAVDANGKQAYFSNSGQGLTLSAPGVGVPGAWGTDKIALLSGTSQASALVAGAAAAYMGWGFNSNGVPVVLRENARSTGAMATQVGAGVLMIRPPAGR